MHASSSLLLKASHPLLDYGVVPLAALAILTTLTVPTFPAVLIVCIVLFLSLSFLSFLLLSLLGLSFQPSQLSKLSCASALTTSLRLTNPGFAGTFPTSLNSSGPQWTFAPSAIALTRLSNCLYVTALSDSRN